MQTNSVNTLQETINKRAEKRLEEDIQYLINNIHRDSRIFEVLRNISFNRQIEILPHTVDGLATTKTTNESVASMFYSIDSYIPQIIKKALLSEYILMETKLFLSEIEELKVKVNDLDNQVQSIPNKYDE